jgi:hypothetical protein
MEIGVILNQGKLSKVVVLLFSTQQKGFKVVRRKVQM